MIPTPLITDDLDKPTPANVFKTYIKMAIYV